jgi:hypothetical protein
MTTDKYAVRYHPATGRGTITPILMSRSPCGVSSDGDGRDRCRALSVARARRRATELVFDNDLRFLWSMTFATEPRDYQEVTLALRNLTRRLRATGLILPRLTVPEQSQDGRWHLHVGVAVYVPYRLMKRAWGSSFIGVPDFKKANEPWALQAISAYLTKSFDQTPPRCRRYVRSAGLRTVEQRFTAPDEATALAMITNLAGVQPEYVGAFGGTTLACYPVAPQAPSA